MRVPWIRVHGRLFDKPVVDRLCRALRIKEHDAIGVLVTFWSGVAEHAPNGQIGDAPAAQLAKWARLAGKRGEQFAAWVRTEHQDEDGRVPEWDDYAGELEYQRERNRLNQKNFRNRRKERLDNLRQQTATGDVSGAAGDRNADVSGTSPTTVRNGTERYGTGEGQQTKEVLSRDRAKQPRDASQDPPSWVAQLTAMWIDKVGAVAHGRLGKALKPVVDKYGVEAIAEALDVYGSGDEGPKTGRSVEQFAQNFQHWLRTARMPIVGPGGILTERGQRVGRA